MRAMRNIFLYCFTGVVFLTLVSASQSIPYRHIDKSWELQMDGEVDSLTFFTSDTLEFYHDYFKIDNSKTFLSLDKSDKTFYIKLKSQGIHGVYEINRSKKMLVLYSCHTPSEDTKSWVKFKTDTFSIQELSKEELVLTH